MNFDTVYNDLNKACETIGNNIKAEILAGNAAKAAILATSLGGLVTARIILEDIAEIVRDTTEVASEVDDLAANLNITTATKEGN